MNVLTQEDRDYIFKVNELIDEDIYMKFKYEKLKLKKALFDESKLELKSIEDRENMEPESDDSLRMILQIQKVDALKDCYDLERVEFKRLKADFIVLSNYLSMTIFTRQFMFNDDIDEC